MPRGRSNHILVGRHPAYIHTCYTRRKLRSKYLSRYIRRTIHVHKKTNKKVLYSSSCIPGGGSTCTYNKYISGFNLFLMYLIRGRHTVHPLRGCQHVLRNICYNYLWLSMNALRAHIYMRCRYLS